MTCFDILYKILTITVVQFQVGIMMLECSNLKQKKQWQNIDVKELGLSPVIDLARWWVRAGPDFSCWWRPSGSSRREKSGLGLDESNDANELWRKKNCLCFKGFFNLSKQNYAIVKTETIINTLHFKVLCISFKNLKIKEVRSRLISLIYVGNNITTVVTA